MKKLDYKGIAKERGFKFIKEDGKRVFVEDEFGGSTECFDLSIKDEAIKLLQCVA